MIVTSVSVALIVAALVIAYVGLGLTARDKPQPVVEVVYLEEFTLDEPYVMYRNGRRAPKYVR